MPTLSWYSRRFGKLLQDSDLGKTVSPFIQPLISTYLTSVGLAITSPNPLTSHQYRGAKAALADPKRLAAYLVTTDQLLLTARYFG